MGAHTSMLVNGDMYISFESAYASQTSFKHENEYLVVVE